MHEYQEKIVQWMRQREEGYLAIDMGLGKTLCVLEYLRATSQKALIIAPLQVALHTWPREIKKWTPELSYHVAHGSKKELQDAELIIINYDGLKWLSLQDRKILQGRCLILDEATAIKNHSALRTKLLAAMRINFSSCFALSATPAPQGIIDLWGQFRVLDCGKRLGKKWTPFFTEYFTADLFHRPIAKAHAIEEITKKVSDAIIKLDADDYLKLPPFINNDVLLSLPQSLVDKYEKFKEELAMLLENDEAVIACNAAVLSCKLRQFIQGFIYMDDGQALNLHSLKLDALEEVHESFDGSPHLVAVAFRHEFEGLQHRFGLSLPIISGATPQKERLRHLDAWNAGDLPMLAIHPATISHGVNLQDGGHHITWLALPWGLEQYIQVNGRLRRQGQKNPVILTRILLQNTIDEKIANSLARKDQSQSNIFTLLREELKSLEG